jgi:hypothetical protein
MLPTNMVLGSFPFHALEQLIDFIGRDVEAIAIHGRVVPHGPLTDGPLFTSLLMLRNIDSWTLLVLF